MVAAATGAKKHHGYQKPTYELPVAHKPHVVNPLDNCAGCWKNHFRHISHLKKNAAYDAFYFGPQSFASFFPLQSWRAREIWWQQGEGRGTSRRIPLPCQQSRRHLFPCSLGCFHQAVLFFQQPLLSSGSARMLWDESSSDSDSKCVFLLGPECNYTTLAQYDFSGHSSLSKQGLVFLVLRLPTSQQRLNAQALLPTNAYLSPCCDLLRLLLAVYQAPIEGKKPSQVRLYFFSFLVNHQP